MTPISTRVLSGLLEARTGQTLVPSRSWRIETALKPLMRERDLPSLEHLLMKVAGGRDAGLSDQVVEALLNNETFFFRDLAAFKLLIEQALAGLADSRNADRRLRIWCAGCSTGQEAYSLAMSFADAPERWAGWTIEILGTDVSRSAVERAREGLYSQFEIQRGLPVRQMVKWFDPEGKEWRLRLDLRRKVSFHLHNLIGPPPAVGRFDVVLCRNVMLYFTPEVRRGVFERISQVIAPDGVLMLGAGETVLGQTERFVSDPLARGLYRPRDWNPGREANDRAA